MLLETKHFGSIQIDESGIVDFPEGLLGFDNIKKFILLGKENEETPFRWLQGVDDPKLAFVVVDPFLIKKDYDIEIDDEKLKTIAIDSESDLQLYSVVVIPEDINKMSMNLKAPVIINTKGHKGIQVILDSDKYSVRHYIMDELHRQEVVKNAGSDKKEGAIHCNK